MFDGNSIGGTEGAATLLAAVLTLAACSGTDQRRYDRPDDTREVISDDDLARIADEGFDVHEGDEPPEIAGTYRWDSARWVHASRESLVGEKACDGLLDIEQRGAREVQLNYSYRDDCSGSGRTRTDVVSGSGDCFTLYGTVEGEFEGCSHESTILTSGCRAPRGIEEYQRVIVNKSIGDSARCETLVEERRMPRENEFVIVSEVDGVVARVESDSWTVRSSDTQQ